VTDHSTCDDLMPGTEGPLVKEVRCERPANHEGRHEHGGLYRWPQPPTTRHGLTVPLGSVEEAELRLRFASKSDWPRQEITQGVPACPLEVRGDWTVPVWR
jgi:hypothetical protein